MTDTNTKEEKTARHRIFGSFLEELLTPVGISVQSGVPVMAKPPKVDILLLRNNRKIWE